MGGDESDRERVWCGYVTGSMIPVDAGFTL
jgi:hypothetical protein